MCIRDRSSSRWERPHRSSRRAAIASRCTSCPGPTCSSISWAARTSRVVTLTAKRWILVAAVLGSGIVFLDSTVVNVALPRIGRDLPRSFLGVLEGQSYVYNAYLLTLSSLLILAGALSDFYGRKRMFLYGLIGFGATSVLCGLAPSMELLVLSASCRGQPAPCSFQAPWPCSRRTSPVK